MEREVNSRKTKKALGNSISTFPLVEETYQEDQNKDLVDGTHSSAEIASIDPGFRKKKKVVITADSNAASLTMARTLT